MMFFSTAVAMDSNFLWIKYTTLQYSNYVMVNFALQKCYIIIANVVFIRAQEPKAPVTYCDHALSGVRPSVRRPSVRPSVVRRPLDYLHFRLLLQNRLMDFDETWYGWSTQGPLQVLLFFGQIRPGADPGQSKNRSREVPFYKKLLLQTGRLQQQTECIAVI